MCGRQSNRVPLLFSSSGAPSYSVDSTVEKAAVGPRKGALKKLVNTEGKGDDIAELACRVLLGFFCCWPTVWGSFCQQFLFRHGVL